MNEAIPFGYPTAYDDDARSVVHAQPTPPPTLHGPHDLTLDVIARRAHVADRELPMTTQLFDLLAFFLQQRGRAVSFDQLASEVWAYPYLVGDHHFLHTAVYRLRRILLAAGIDDLIEGVRGFGYRIAAAAEPLAISRHTTSADGPAVAAFDPFDPDLRLSMANHAALELTGYEIRDLMSIPDIVARLWTPPERAIIDRTVRDAVRDGSARTEGRQMIRAGGETIQIDVVISRLDLAEGSQICIVEAQRSNH